MTDVLDAVRDHYGAAGLTGRLKAALAAVFGNITEGRLAILTAVFEAA